METTDNYRVPELSEFVEGFEFEILYPDGWKKKTWGVDEIDHPELKEFDNHPDPLMKMAHAILRTRIKSIAEEAKEMVNKIYQPLGHLSCNVSNNEMWEYAKKRAVEMVEYFIKKMPEGSANWLHHRKLVDEINKL